MVWSLCNEQECEFGFSSTIAEMFKEISKKADPRRPIPANQNFNFGNGLSQVIDIQGVSHRDGDMFDTIHSRMPTKPVIGSEYCFCRTQRGEDIVDSSTMAQRVTHQMEDMTYQSILHHYLIHTLPLHRRTYNKTVTLFT